MLMINSVHAGKIARIWKHVQTREHQHNPSCDSAPSCSKKKKKRERKLKLEADKQEIQ